MEAIIEFTLYQILLVGCIIVTVAGLIMIKKWLILKERHFLEINFQVDA